MPINATLQRVKTAEDFWQEQDETYNKIYQLGMQAYIDSTFNREDLLTVFQLRDRTLRCIDEGTPCGYHIAGSGILSGLEETARMFQGHVDGVTSHEECGAAKLYAKEHGLSEEKIEEYAKAFAKTLTVRLEAPYKGHIPIGEMKRPSGLHIARCVYVDCTGTFEPSQETRFPPGFVVSRAFMSQETARKNVEIAYEIATGSHGFGSRIDREHPFLVIIVRDDQNEQLSHSDGAFEFMKLEENSAGRMRIDTMNRELTC